MPNLNNYLKPASLVSGHGQVVTTEKGWRLSIPAGPSGKYRLAQIDDYHDLRRREFHWNPPVRLSLRARLSPGVTSGTWGFGLWNDPFGIALNPLGRRLLLPTQPQAAWFFWASPASYLSLRDDLPANGILAQAFKSAPGWRELASIAFALAVRRAAARRMLRQRVTEDSRRLEVDLQSWHSYELLWEQSTVEYLLDGNPVLRTAFSPRPPLGLVIWIDSQYAAFDPTGRIAWGFERNDAGASLEISNLRLERHA